MRTYLARHHSAEPLSLAQLREALPQCPDLQGRHDVPPVPAEQPSVQVPAEVLLAPLLEDRFVRCGTVVVIVQVEVPSATPGKLMRQLQQAMVGAVQFVE
jgi:hypothetical protein